MSLIEILLVVAATIGICAGIPQLLQLLKTKNSEELSLKTWAMWVGTQSVSAAYSFSIGDKFLSTINSIWVLFYFAMSVLIVYYSPKMRARRAAKLVLVAIVPPSQVRPQETSAQHS